MVKVTRLGHAAVLIEGTKTIIVDPYIKENPAASTNIDQIPKVDYVLVTHDHFDHFGEAVELAKRDNASLVGVYELTTRKDVTDAGITAIGPNIGGTYKEEDIAISLTPAVHSSIVGSPSGFVIALDGITIYQSGDTALFNDMEHIAKLFGPIDLALLPIGGFYTMDEKAAATATKLIKPKVVIPIHYDTWPPIEADTKLFSELAHEFAHVEILAPGETYEIT